MANIRTGGDGSVYAVRRFLGLNENPDGDTELKAGEAAVMRNFRVTREGSLQIRPGYAPICTLAEGSPVRGLWSGYVDGAFHLLAACGGTVWDIDREAGTASAVGTAADAQACFFGFARKVYLLDGTDYCVWDGTGEFAPVEGYAPIVATAAPPAGGGTLLEPVNKLTGSKRQQFSPDGTAKVFQLAETSVDSVDSVELDGTVLTSGFTVNTSAGTVTFTATPAAGTNTLEIGWTKGTGDRAAVTGMRFAELFNGAQDTRVFLYGDGTNRMLYSGLDEDGAPTAEYFPDLNVLDAGSGNTPVTGLVRHLSRLVVFKSDSAYAVRYAALTLDDGTVTAGFYVSPIHRAVGHAAAGQVALVENNPWTLSGGAAYEWKPSGAYGDLGDSERQAVRRSDRVSRTLGGFDLGACAVFDDGERQELYLVCGGEALVYNYAADAWYAYDNFPAACLALAGGELYFGTPEGALMRLSRDFRNDAGAEIDAYWESGAMAFGRDWQRKHCPELWVAMKPEGQGRVTVTAQSDRRSDYAEKVIASGLSTFRNASFACLSFGTNRKPRVRRVKLRVKKFTYCKLIFASRSASAAATILSADFHVRAIGNII